MHRNTRKVVEDLYTGNEKLYFWCILVGLLTGATVYFYRISLKLITEFRDYFFEGTSLNTPLKLFKIWIVFILVGLLINYLTSKFPRISGSGVPQVKGLILEKVTYKKWWLELVVKFFTGVLGIGAGLSFGRAGPSVQFGSYIGYGLSKISKKNIADRNYLVTSGASAGLSGVFGTPLAGIMFSIEEIHKYVSGKLLTCLFLASISSNFIIRILLGYKTSINIPINYPLELDFLLQFALYILLGVIVGILGKTFTYTLIKSKDIFNETTKIRKEIKISFVMTLSFIICFIFPEITIGGNRLTESLGEFKTTIAMLIIIFIVKLLFTSITYATGFAGGLFFPIFIMGALIGKIFGEVTNQIMFLGADFTVHCIVLGMAAYFVAVMRAPITGAVLILEMTGSFDLLFAMITVSAVAFYITELLGQKPLCEILYQKMNKDEQENLEEFHIKKTIIEATVTREAYYENKKISEIGFVFLGT